VFPDELRNQEWEEKFFRDNNFGRATKRLDIELTQPELNNITSV
jgi:hypothetical protein